MYYINERGMKIMSNESELKKELSTKMEDLYKIAKILHQYCLQNNHCEEVNDLLPLTKQLCSLSDNVFCNLAILVDGTDPDEGITE